MLFLDLIDSLPSDPLERGRTFERLCRWYLQSAPEYRDRVRKIWLWNEWPDRWGPDAGIDLVVETVDDELWALQAKAYGVDQRITKTDVEKFLSESNRPQFAFRLLIATTDQIGRTALRTLHGQEKPVGLLMRSHLAAAELEWPDDLELLKAPRRPPAVPYPYQEEAVENVVNGFREADRGQLIMACGTGKTLVSMWVSEALGCERTLVLVPSLTLLAQTMRAWTANATAPFIPLAVCSDETVTEHDAMVSHTADLGLPVTTDPAEVTAFLSRPGRCVVFGTYQSSPRLADAQDQGAPPFDLAVADEAHRCAGSVTGDFATILSDDRIRARKRLFMTATPRYFTDRIRKLAGQSDFEIASMDDKEQFGPVFHTLTFGEAIERDLLSDYIVLVIGTDESTYRIYLERGELVTTDGGVISDARTLGSHIGLAKAMRKHDLRRVVSFHGRVNRAQEFSSLFPRVVAWMPQDEQPPGAIWASHVSGKMSSGKRDGLLSRLRNLDEGSRGLLSNARCLGEGVDLPAIDGVAFIDPRGSQIDIIQAVGRAIRLSPEKKVGVIVLPVFITEDDDPEQALNESPFKTVWSVLNALRAHDEVLAEELDAIRRRIGRVQTADTRRPAKIILDVPELVGAEFARAFDVRMVTSVTASWEFWFGLLERFVAREGDARIPVERVEGGFPLGRWAAVQRGRYNLDKLDPERQRRLDFLPGWSWIPDDDDWEEHFALLEQYAAREGDSRVPRKHVEDGFSLGEWVAVQRRLHARDKLDPERQRRLKALHRWSWGPTDDDWEEHFALFEQYVAREGHARVPAGHEEGGLALRTWVNNQRARYKLDKLDPERRRRLKAVRGWNRSPDDRWEEHFALLEQYAAREGDSRVPMKHVEDGFKLGSWVGTQRRRCKLDKLYPERRRLLKALPGWRWTLQGGRRPSKPKSRGE